MISESERDVKYAGGQDAGEKLTFDAVAEVQPVVADTVRRYKE